MVWQGRKRKMEEEKRNEFVVSPWRERGESGKEIDKEEER